jgi:hypothetical protein
VFFLIKRGQDLERNLIEKIGIFDDFFVFLGVPWVLVRGFWPKWPFYAYQGVQNGHFDWFWAMGGSKMAILTIFLGFVGTCTGFLVFWGVLG